MRNNIFFLFYYVFSSCASKLSKILKSTDYEYKYKMAEKYYAEKKYSNAQLLFEDLFPIYKGHQNMKIFILNTPIPLIIRGIM